MKLPQLSLRELFLLVAVVAMGCGWWRDQDRLSRERDSMREREKALQVAEERVRKERNILAHSELTLNEERQRIGMRPTAVQLLPSIDD